VREHHIDFSASNYFFEVKTYIKIGEANRVMARAKKQKGKKGRNLAPKKISLQAPPGF
jgi:hypothetical protein